MRLIANKPCSFGGRKLYNGDEIPENLVADARLQEKLGVITIVNDVMGVSGEKPGSLFTQEQVEAMIAEAMDEAEKKRADQLAELQEHVAELEKMGPGEYDGAIPISVKGESDEQQTAVPATPEEIQQVFSIMQMNATEGTEAIAGVKSENILILLHAADTRKTIKDAAKKQVDNIFSTSGRTNESAGGNATTGTNTEGADT